MDSYTRGVAGRACDKTALKSINPQNTGGIRALPTM